MGSFDLKFEAPNPINLNERSGRLSFFNRIKAESLNSSFDLVGRLNVDCLVKVVKSDNRILTVTVLQLRFLNSNWLATLSTSRKRSNFKCSKLSMSSEKVVSALIDLVDRVV